MPGAPPGPGAPPPPSARPPAGAPPGVPTPESVLGFAVGADFKLATYDESIRYFERLAASSNRIKLVDVGKTSTGHAWTLAIISSPENLANLEHLRDIAQKLAHPAGLSDAQARSLAKEGKAFVDISGGLHASEIAGSQHTIQLAYDLLSRNDEKTRAILDNTVLLLWPSINPDGQNIVVNWYRENVGTPYEVSPAERAVPEVHRPRQQPRRVHAERRRVARGGAHVARSGSRRSSTCSTRRRPFPRASGCRRSPNPSRRASPA